MKTYLLIPSLLLALYLPVHAEDIDLRCEDLAAKMLERLSSEGLLGESPEYQKRARAITLELCTGAQESAQQQHEAGKQEAISNWFWESRPDKPGNRRLKRLK